MAFVPRSTPVGPKMKSRLRLALLVALTLGSLGIVLYLWLGGPTPEARVRRTLDALVAAIRVDAVGGGEAPERRLPRMHATLVTHLTPDAVLVDEEWLGVVDGRDAIEALIAQAPALGDDVQLSLHDVRVRVLTGADGGKTADVDAVGELRANHPERREERALHLHLRFDGEDGAPRIDRIEARKKAL